MGGVHFLVEFSPFKRKPFSLIFGIRNNKFEDFIKHHTHLCLLSFFSYCSRKMENPHELPLASLIHEWDIGNRFCNCHVRHSLP